MNVRELSREQLTELKATHLDEMLREKENRSASWGELAEADSIVKDEEVFEHYDGTNFTNEDFSCTAGLVACGTN